MALDLAGERAAARRFHDWVAARIVEHEPAMLRAARAVHAGGRPEPSDHLPCRFGRDGDVPRGDGWGSFQMDGPGLWLWAVERHVAQGPGRLQADDVLRAAAVPAAYVAALWRVPSYDAWEEHGGRLSSSTLAACLAGSRAAHRLGVGTAATEDAARAIAAELATRGRSGRGLPRSDVDPGIDASLLWCGPLLGIWSAEDEAWRATLDRVRDELLGPDGGVHRYAADMFYGGGAWPVLTAALGLAELRLDGPGDIERAHQRAAWIEAQRTPHGLLPEQASTHLLHPERLAEWRVRWGPVATPLSWSHAMALLLRGSLAGS